jgi:hypothetical protein
MNPLLDRFVTSCPRSPAASCNVRQFVAAFRAAIAPADRRAWSRTRVVAELSRAGYAIGADRHGRACIVGVGLALTVRDGRLAIA